MRRNSGNHTRYGVLDVLPAEALVPDANRELGVTE